MSKKATILIPIFTLILSVGSLTSKAQNWDVDLLKHFNPVHPDSKYWSATSNSVYWVPATVSIGHMIYGIIADDPNARRNGFQLLTSAIVSTAMSEIIKNAVNRQRPAETYPDKIFVNSPVHGKSFPSGHTSLAFATATTLSLEYKKWYVAVPAYLWAGSVAYSRMYEGCHYPSDILGGIAVGVGSAYLNHWLNKKLFKR